MVNLNTMQRWNVMKQIFLLAALAVLLNQGAQAVELNKDAMKTMQQEGHRIVEESKGSRAYKAGNNLCLDTGGGGLLVRKCSDGAKTQKWTMDNQKRLVAHDGRCVAGAQLAKCGAGKGQKWKHDDKKRLFNQNKQCLQVQGNPPKAGAKVTVAACGNEVAGQTWK
jgi:hypothetical protein